MDSEQLELAKAHYQQGKAAFERGQYRQSVQLLEKAASLTERITRLGGEIRIWLVMSYEANGQRQDAIALCRQVGRHPDIETAKQGRRLLYILEAPRLKTRPEWLTQIPDLSGLDNGDAIKQGTSKFAQASKKPRRKAKPEDPAPIDWSQVNTKDNRFVWVALLAIALLTSSLFLFK